jgi:hypothetical protein
MSEDSLITFLKPTEILPKATNLSIMFWSPKNNNLMKKSITLTDKSPNLKPTLSKSPMKEKSNTTNSLSDNKNTLKLSKPSVIKKKKYINKKKKKKIIKRLYLNIASNLIQFIQIK